jgi:hypothetical protein
MRKIALVALLFSGFALAGASCGSSSSSNSSTERKAAPAAAVPNPAMTVPDETAWNLFIQAVGPAPGDGTLFETWASDTDTFTPGGKFPGTRDMLDLRPAILPEVDRAIRAPGGPHARLLAQAPGTTGAAPNAAAPAAGAYPPAPSTEPGAADALVEEVRRNQPAFDFITGNHLNSRSGLIAAFKANMDVSFPTDSLEVKTNWLPVSVLPTYYPNAKQTDFYVVNVAGKPYALIAMHVISKQVPNWTWATFEHQLNPGRCDIIGCNDLYGAADQHVPAADNQGQNQGSVYPPCAKSAALQAALSAAGVAPVFGNYCLKGSQADFTDNTGLAVRLGNSVTEYNFVWQASCMTCHGVANFDANGKSTTVFGFLNGKGQLGAIDPVNYWNSGALTPPVYQGMPGLVRAAVSADFVWSIPFCAYDDVTDPQHPVVNKRCVGK